MREAFTWKLMVMKGASWARIEPDMRVEVQVLENPHRRNAAKVPHWPSHLANGRAGASDLVWLGGRIGRGKGQRSSRRQSGFNVKMETINIEGGQASRQSIWRLLIERAARPSRNPCAEASNPVKMAPKWLAAEMMGAKANRGPET